MIRPSAYNITWVDDLVAIEIRVMRKLFITQCTSERLLPYKTKITNACLFNFMKMTATEHANQKYFAKDIVYLESMQILLRYSHISHKAFFCT